MAEQRINATLKYQKVRGGAWVSQDFTVYLYFANKVTEKIHEQVLQQDREIYQYFVDRARIRFEVPVAQLNEKNDPTHAKYVFLQEFNGAQVKFLSTNGVSVDGWTLWNATDNTNYLIHEGQPFAFPQEKRTQRPVTFSLITAKDV